MKTQPKYNSVFRSDLFEGKRALVTGGGTGIGRCIAHELAALGAKVIIAGRREEPLLTTLEEIQKAGGEATSVQLNIRDEGQVSEVIAALVAEGGPIHLLVNNAGGQFASPASMMKPKGWRAVIDTNLNGTFLVTQALFNHSMMENGGSVVNIVAEMWNGFPGMAHTGAARAGVVNLTKTLALEWASCGVRVNSVAPGYVLSSGLNNYPEMVQEMAAELMPKNPSSRLATESEVSAAVAFLLSPAAGYITGTTMKVDGGSSLQKAPLFEMEKHQEMEAFNGFHLPAEVPDLFKQ